MLLEVFREVGEKCVSLTRENDVPDTRGECLGSAIISGKVILRRGGLLQTAATAWSAAEVDP